MLTKIIRRATIGTRRAQANTKVRFAASKRNIFMLACDAKKIRDKDGNEKLRPTHFGFRVCGDHDLKIMRKYMLRAPQETREKWFLKVREYEQKKAALKDLPDSDKPSLPLGVSISHGSDPNALKTIQLEISKEGMPYENYTTPARHPLDETWDWPKDTQIVNLGSLNDKTGKALVDMIAKTDPRTPFTHFSLAGSEKAVHGVDGKPLKDDMSNWSKEQIVNWVVTRRRPKMAPNCAEFGKEVMIRFAATLPGDQQKLADFVVEVNARKCSRASDLLKVCQKFFQIDPHSREIAWRRSADNL